MKLLGWVPDTIDLRDYKYKIDKIEWKGILAKYELPKPVIKTQQGNSCVSCAVTAAFESLLKKLHNREGALDAYYNYYNARIIDLKKEKTPLAGMQDEGTSIRSSLKAANKYGFIARNALYAALPSCTHLPIMSYIISHRLGFKYGKIDDTGDELIARVCQALINNQAVIIGAYVDNDFLQDTGPDIIDYQDGPKIGGHAMFVRGFLKKQNQLVFSVVNSWGPEWRVDGEFFATSKFVEHCADITVIDLKSVEIEE